MPSEKNKKNTNKKPTPRASSKKPKPQPGSGGLRFEIFAICAIALCMYLLICIYSNAGGFVGSWIKKIIMGLAGTCAYILPFATAALLIYSLCNRHKESNKAKYIMTYSAVAVLGAIFQRIFASDVAPAEWFANGSAGGISGGFVGGALTAVLSIFGTAGSYLILFCALIVLVILIFNISLAHFFDSVRLMVRELGAKEPKAPAKAKPATETNRGVAIDPDLERAAFSDREIVFNIPEEESTPTEEESFADPEIRVYDDVTSGPEDMEPSDEEKEAKKLSDDEKESIDREIKEEIEGAEKKKEIIEYTYPSTDLLSKPQPVVGGANVQDELRSNARQLIETLHSFKVDAKVVEISQGPTITRYEIEPAEGIRVNQITNLSKDIGLKFKADKGVMVAPVPGKSTIGIEIENKTPSTVTLREVIESDEFKNHKSKLAVALGKDVSGKPIIMDLAKMPHLLIAGATGAGKSVCINTLIISLLYKADPNEVKLVMVDPKQVELGVYNGIPHLLIPVVKDAKKATGALSWAVQEMTERYSIFERNNVRNIKGYNELMERNGTPENKMASIVIIIDEFADLMMVDPLMLKTMCAELRSLPVRQACILSLPPKDLL